MAVLVVATAVTVGTGVGARLACSRPCISDLPSLYRSRAIRPDAPPYLDRNLEYPVLVGAAFYAATFVSSGARSFFTVTGLGLAVLALIGTYLLARRAGRRAWYWALAPPLLLYGAANWDLLAVVPAIAGIVAFGEGLDATSGVMLGIGAAAKLYPGLFVPVFVAARLRDRDARGALRLLTGALATVALVNLPVLAASPSGWLYPLRFQSSRDATWGSLWHYVLSPPGIGALLPAGVARSLTNGGAVIAVVAGVAAVSVLVWRGRLDPVVGAGIATAVFLVANKVYSPQYDLWFVPFFVLLAVPWRDYAAFVVLDAAVFGVVFGRLGHHYRWTVTWAWFLGALVLARALTMAWTLRDARPLPQSLPEPPRSGPAEVPAGEAEVSVA